MRKTQMQIKITNGKLNTVWVLVKPPNIDKTIYNNQIIYGNIAIRETIKRVQHVGPWIFKCLNIPIIRQNPNNEGNKFYTRGYISNVSRTRAQMETTTGYLNITWVH